MFCVQLEINRMAAVGIGSVKTPFYREQGGATGGSKGSASLIPGSGCCVS